ncbi:hypothetical protein KIN20_005456 [Parelaphostrongylus tenuis]|uniref:Uncharacterized protein n=1 Tax=Parelaphostrongylus tenuis TaxID=148309 RepID=A0AAD5M039_PARTN|nr:hypothetical protein KIN20_005456 [Parelaphostrongylus tenuis]
MLAPSRPVHRGWDQWVIKYIRKCGPVCKGWTHPRWRAKQNPRGLVHRRKSQLRSQSVSGVDGLCRATYNNEDRVRELGSGRGGESEWTKPAEEGKARPVTTPARDEDVHQKWAALIAAPQQRAARPLAVSRSDVPAMVMSAIALNCTEK